MESANFYPAIGTCSLQKIKTSLSRLQVATTGVICSSLCCCSARKASSPWGRHWVNIPGSSVCIPSLTPAWLTQCPSKQSTAPMEMKEMEMKEMEMCPCPSLSEIPLLFGDFLHLKQAALVFASLAFLPAFNWSWTILQVQKETFQHQTIP